MNLKLEIKRNVDGIVAVNVWKDWNFNTYWWTQGNAGCDCNRELFFLRAKGEDEPEETECGEGRYSIRLSDADTAEILYNEFNE